MGMLILVSELNYVPDDFRVKDVCEDSMEISD